MAFLLWPSWVISVFGKMLCSLIIMSKVPLKLWFLPLDTCGIQGDQWDEELAIQRHSPRCHGRHRDLTGWKHWLRRAIPQVCGISWHMLACFCEEHIGLRTVLANITVYHYVGLSQRPTAILTFKTHGQLNNINSAITYPGPIHFQN